MWIAAQRVLRAYSGSAAVRLLLLGVWILVCMSLYDRVQPNIKSVLDVGEQMKRAAKLMLVYQHAPPPKVIHRPFDEKLPKMALILGYQRCGSTFTGNIFNQNPEAYYLMEPVDGIYTAMYGARPGFSVPSDIANYWNGSERALPAMETQSVADVMSSMLSCDFEQVPTEVLIHRFFYLFKPQQVRLAQYVECLRKYNLNVPNCGKSLKGICPERFGESSAKGDYCRYMLWERDESGNPHYDDHNPKNQETFEKYQLCMRKQRHDLKKCLPEMNEVCESSKLRTAKTVRLSMESAEIMFKQLANFRVIHLIRDPRAVVLSRQGDPTYHGKFSGGSLVKEASLYCRGVLRDVLVRRRIEERFPGSVLQVIYEHFVSNPLEQVRAIYSFLGEEMHPSVEEWLIRNTAGAVKNSTKIAEKWQEKMTFKMARSINEACADLFNAIGYNWPQAT